MPELPDISAYLSALQNRIIGQPLERVRLNSAFLLRTAAPPISEAAGHQVTELRRIERRGGPAGFPRKDPVLHQWAQIAERQRGRRTNESCSFVGSFAACARRLIALPSGSTAATL